MQKGNKNMNKTVGVAKEKEIKDAMDIIISNIIESGTKKGSKNKGGFVLAGDFEKGKTMTLLGGNQKEMIAALTSMAEDNDDLKTIIKEVIDFQEYLSIEDKYKGTMAVNIMEDVYKEKGKKGVLEDLVKAKDDMKERGFSNQVIGGYDKFVKGMLKTVETKARGENKPTGYASMIS